MTKYLFVDGAYLRERMADFSQRVYGLDQVPIDFEGLRAEHGFHKAYYYDSPPARDEKAGETTEDYERRIQPYVALTNGVRELNGWHVFDGVAKRRKSGSSQKEVDVKIAVDLLTNAVKNNMDEACLIAGDQDFRPVVEAVVREKTFLTLWFAKSSISSELRYAADARLLMDAFFLDQLVIHSARPFPMPPKLRIRYPLSADHTRLSTRVVGANGSEWALYLRPSNNNFVLVDISGEHDVAYCHIDKDVLRRVFAFEHGLNEWID